VRINVALLRLHRLQHCLQQEQEEMDAFLTDYFHTIARHLPPHIALASSEDDIPQTETSARTHAQTSAQLDALEQLMRQLYRRLARQCHPDHNPDIAPQTMQEVNRAYDNRELGSLMLLSQQVFHVGTSDTTPTFTLSDLQHYYQQIQQLSQHTEAALQALRQSDEYKLRRQMLLARLEGRDMVSRVAEGITWHLGAATPA
jgi:hypothetical protein